ncbi:hypothetical protein JHN49_06225 [Streptomyces sp. MBT57]|nr:hypothetical protein [Streptomyces sp. MBT57]
MNELYDETDGSDARWTARERGVCAGGSAAASWDPEQLEELLASDENLAEDNLEKLIEQHLHEIHDRLVDQPCVLATRSSSRGTCPGRARPSSSRTDTSYASRGLPDR